MQSETETQQYVTAHATTMTVYPLQDGEREDCAALALALSRASSCKDGGVILVVLGQFIVLEVRQVPVIS